MRSACSAGVAFFASVGFLTCLGLAQQTPAAGVANEIAIEAHTSISSVSFPI
jgi:hypothetical protein